MAVQNWSEQILMVALADDPLFSQDLDTLLETVCQNKEVDVALDFANCTFVNSSNLTKLLKLRKILIRNYRQLVLCGITHYVWGIFLITDLDKFFFTAQDLAAGLAGLQKNPAGLPAAVSPVTSNAAVSPC